MNVLDKSFHTFANFPLPNSNTLSPLPCDLITSKRFAEDSHKGAVSRKKDRVRRLVNVSAFSRNIQPDECFAGSRHTRHEANEFAPSCSSLIYKFFNPRGCHAQVLCACIIARNGFYRMLSIKSTSGFNDGGCRMIRCAQPTFTIDDFFCYGL